jgi:1-acyl-sn-glycerol-3-phosphate acyltransferase
VRGREALSPAAEDVVQGGEGIEAPARRLPSLRRGWRAFRTGVAFVMFGLGAVLISVVAVPILRLTSRRPGALQRRTQALIHHAFRLFAWFMTVTGLIRVTWTGRERLRERPILVIANHPTLIDVVLLVAAMPQADCIVKTAAERRPLFRRIVNAAGYIPNDRPDAIITAGAESLRQGRPLLLFPEGTRSPSGRLGRFHRGAARIALRSGSDLIPVVITCSPPTLMKGQRWYDVPERTAHITLTVKAPIRVREHPAALKTEAGGARELTDLLQGFYERELRSSR